MAEWTELFDGKSLQGWKGRKGKGDAAPEHTWMVVGGVTLHPEHDTLLVARAAEAAEAGRSGKGGTGVLVNGDDGRTSDLQSELEHGDCELHIEFCVAAKSNSGVYLQGQYEIQILDSWGETESTFKSCGALYPRWITETQTAYEGKAPGSNASKRPGEWQSFDIVFRAPRFDGSGKKVANARFEKVTHNGVVIHEGYEYQGPSRGSWNPEDIAQGPIRLQGDHGPVAFRNVRIRPLD